MFPSQRLKDTAANHLVRNHVGRLLPVESMGVLAEEGFFNFRGYAVTCRSKVEQTMGLGFEDPSLALIVAMDRSARALCFDDTVSVEQQSYLAEIMEGKILATFVSGVDTRSADIASFNSDVKARKVEIDGRYYWQIWGTKGVATNAEGCHYAAVSIREEGDESEFGGRFVFVKMHDDAGNPAEGVTIHDTGHTLGVPSTRSGSVTFDVLVPEHLVLPWVPNLLAHFLIKNAIDSFGLYTGAYIRAAMRVVMFMEDKNKRERLVSRISGCYAAVQEAEGILLAAADLRDGGEAPLMAVAEQLLVAKRSIGKAIEDHVLPLATYMLGFHDFAFSWDQAGMAVFVPALLMANPQPPSSLMIDDIFEGLVQLPQL